MTAVAPIGGANRGNGQELAPEPFVAGQGHGAGRGAGAPPYRQRLSISWK